MRLIFLGPPGSGKGTQAGLLTKELDIIAISTGDIFRAELKNETPLGKKAKSFMDAGELVPDEVVIGMVESRISQDDCQKGYILDGFPRTVPQAEGLDAILAKMGSGIDHIIEIKADEDIIVKRLTGRQACEKCKTDFNRFFHPPKEEGICDLCGGKLISRADDTEETIRHRLDVYSQDTAPLLDYYGDKIISVDGSAADPQIAYNVILAAIR